MILDCKKTLLKIWFNPGLNIWTTARSEFLCRDSDYVSTSYDKRTVWMTPGGGGDSPDMKGVGMLIKNFELNP